MPSALIIPGVQVMTVFEPTRVGAAGPFSGDIATLGWTAKSLAGGCAR